VAAAVLVVVAGGCGGREIDDGAGALDGSVPETVPDAGFTETPLGIAVRVGNHTTLLDPFSFCYADTCADGAPVPDAALPDVGPGGPLTVVFPRPGWSLTAGLTPLGSSGDEAPVPLRAGPGGTFALDPPGAPGTYVVALFAQGVGDAAYRFRWSL
jgi:hypothetical protein